MKPKYRFFSVTTESGHSLYEIEKRYGFLWLYFGMAHSLDRAFAKIEKDVKPVKSVTKREMWYVDKTGKLIS